MARKASRERFTVKHSNWLEPEDCMRFIHFDGFTSDWRELRLTDDDLRVLQIQIMLTPRSAPVIPGTGGLRKMRFAPPSWNRGKRGAMRVLYAVLPEYSVAVLAAAYAKNEKLDITAEEKRRIRRLLEEMQSILESGG